jgi:hypothetical protein
MTTDEHDSCPHTLLRLRVTTDSDPSVVTRLLGLFQNLNVTPRQVNAEYAGAVPAASSRSVLVGPHTKPIFSRRSKKADWSFSCPWGVRLHRWERQLRKTEENGRSSATVPTDPLARKRSLS